MALLDDISFSSSNLLDNFADPFYCLESNCHSVKGVPLGESRGDEYGSLQRGGPEWSAIEYNGQMEGGASKQAGINSQNPASNANTHMTTYWHSSTQEMGQISANVQADAMAHVGSCDQHYTYSNESNYRTHVPQLHQPHFGWSPATSNQSTYTHIGTPQNGRSYASPQLMQNQYIKEEGTHMVAEYDRDPPNRPRNTKEELLCLLAQLTPAEVDNLKRLYGTRTGQRRRSLNPGMATRIASNDGVGAGSTPNDICDERKLTQSSCESMSTLSSSTTMDMSIDAYDSETDAVAKRGPKNERRASHNLIEKKYRCSINDCIQQLKIMITTDEVKMSKSATLRKAIEYINCLRTRNNELTAENERLRNLLKGYGVETSNSFSQLQSIIDGNSTGSPLSTSSQSTSESSDESSLSRTKQFRGMVDRSRVSIFVFMFMLLAFNPVSFFIASPSQSDSSVRQIIGGRTLKSINSPFEENENDSMWWNDSVIRPCFIWSINIFIVICFLIHLLVYGEPVADGKSSSWTKFLDIQAASERNINDGNLTAAASQLNECLQILERPLPCSGFDEFVSVVWQVIRHILNSIWIGRWFSRRRRSQAKPVAVVCRSYAYTALVYHQLNRLHLIGIDGMNDSLSGLYFALSAVNLSESAGCSRDGLPHAIRADIYIHAAFRVKMSMSSFLGSIFYSYFMRRAKRHLKLEEAESGRFLWIFHPFAKSFLLNSELSNHFCGQSLSFFPFVQRTSSVEPLARLSSAFKMQLLSDLIRGVVSQSSFVPSRCIEISRLLLSMSTATVKMNEENRSLFSPAFLASGDKLCTWWTHVFTCAVYWRMGDSVQAHRHYALIRKCPSSLLANPLASAVGHAFCCRKLCIDDIGSEHFEEAVSAHSAKAFVVLERLSEQCSANELSTPMREMRDVIRMSALEWLLLSSFDVWKARLDYSKPYWDQTPKSHLNALCRDTLRLYRGLAIVGKADRLKVRLLEVMSRMMSGANPMAVWQQTKSFSVLKCDPTWNGTLYSFGSSMLQKNALISVYFDVLRKLRNDLSQFCF